jgi:serine/threonine protein kinase
MEVSDETRVHFEDEMACQVKLRNFGGHPNVLPCLRYFLDSTTKQAALLMEAGIMDLSKLQRNLAYRIPAGSAARYASDIVHGLDYVHSCEIIHRDLKPSNIILCQSPFTNCALVAKIADFGCSRLTALRPLQTTGFCTVYYRAPEVFESVKLAARSDGSASRELQSQLILDTEGVEMETQRRYTFSSDVWSLGCILAELLHSQILLLHKNASEIGILANIAARIGYPPSEVLSLPGLDETRLRAHAQVLFFFGREQLSINLNISTTSQPQRY